MSTDTAENQIKVVLDTNILVSAVTHICIPRDILFLVLEKKIQAVTSPVLIVELLEVLGKKFRIAVVDLQRVEKEIKQQFIIVYPNEIITIQKDDADNRVLEAAVQGNCQFIVTGDKELVRLKNYKKIRIVTVTKFLQLINIPQNN